MDRGIAILRGINVGGKRNILMADLKSMFDNIKFSNVSTYIQSGNVIFDLEKEFDNRDLGQKIEKAIEKEFGEADTTIYSNPPKRFRMFFKHTP